MPQLRTYTVTRTQSVEIRSTDVHKAMLVAEAFLDEKAISSEMGSVYSSSTKTSMSAEEQ